MVLGTAATPEILGQLPRERVVAALDAVEEEAAVALGRVEGEQEGVEVVRRAVGHPVVDPVEQHERYARGERGACQRELLLLRDGPARRVVGAGDHDPGDLAPAAGVAAATAQQKVSLTVEQSVALGLENSKVLHASMMRREAADEKAVEASVQRFPWLRAAGSYTRLSDVPAFQATVPAGAFGPGLLESVYESILYRDLTQRGLRVARQCPVPVWHDDECIELGFRADLIVDDKVIVEIKSVESVAPVHRKQLRTYLRLAGKRLGLLVNFNVVLDQRWHHTGSHPASGVSVSEALRFSSRTLRLCGNTFRRPNAGNLSAYHSSS